MLDFVNFLINEPPSRRVCVPVFPRKISKISLIPKLLFECSPESISILSSLKNMLTFPCSINKNKLSCSLHPQRGLYRRAINFILYKKCAKPRARGESSGIELESLPWPVSNLLVYCIILTGMTLPNSKEP